MSQRVGLWLIGARGGVAATAAAGCIALRHNLVPATGLVSELSPFSGLDLAAWDDVVIGGHEVRPTRLRDEVHQFQTSSRAFAADLAGQVGDELDQIDQNIRPGVMAHAGSAIEALAPTEIANDTRTAREKVQQVQRDLRGFCTEHDLQRLVVINTASTEPPLENANLPELWADLEPWLDRPDCPLPASTLYAIAALESGYGWVNFTPSRGADFPAVRELAQQRGAVHAGSDGKTGETLIKSVLAPAFAMRNLNVMSWVGHNIFGNLDGKVLDAPENKQSKVASKDQLLGEILGYQPQTHISIEYIQSLGDWKTAWDHIHFEGFLGTPMVMQFTWQGCDSILAAPLVLDLFRFAERAQRAGQSGNLDWLACFFKSPEGNPENNLTLQFQQLLAWSESLTG